MKIAPCGDALATKIRWALTGISLLQIHAVNCDNVAMIVRGLSTA